MKYRISEYLLDQVKNNKFLHSKFLEMSDRQNEGDINNFFKENPDFVQILMNLSTHIQIEGVDY